MAKHIERLQKAVDEILAGQSTLRVLEAGCGSMSFMNLKPPTRITGIDISEKQLERNQILDEAICGDIMTYQFPPDSFDIIICLDVLEHLERPELALENFRNTLAPGGLMILKFPNVWSVKGLVTKFSPHWFHVWFYRVVYGRPDAGENDTSPFPTYLRTLIGPPSLRKWARASGLDHVYEDFYESYYHMLVQQKFPWLTKVFKPFEWLVKILSWGKLTAEKTEFVIVLQKPDSPAT